MSCGCKLLPSFSLCRKKRSHYRINEAKQWFYCLACQVGFGSRDRHQWHFSYCPAKNKQDRIKNNDGDDDRRTVQEEQEHGSSKIQQN